MKNQSGVDANKKARATAKTFCSVEVLERNPQTDAWLPHQVRKGIYVHVHARLARSSILFILHEMLGAKRNPARFKNLGGKAGPLCKNKIRATSIKNGGRLRLDMLSLPIYVCDSSRSHNTL